MEWKESANRIWAEDESGKVLAEIDFPESGENLVVINHTEVDSSLQGQGIAGKLTEMAARKIVESGRKAELTCSYAIRWFSRHREFEGALANPEAEYAKAETLAGPACGITRPSK